MKTNKPIRAAAIQTHEGAPAVRINAEAQLRRSVMASLLWEDTFYENGVDIATRVQKLAKAVPADTLAAIAMEARNQMYLRHMPLLLARELARHPNRTNPAVVKHTLSAVIQRPDELGEFLSLYWKDKRQPLSAQVKKGLAAAFAKFDEYQLAKYNRDGAVKLRDVAFLSHVKPGMPADAAVQVVERKYKNGSVAKVLRHPYSTVGKLIDGTLPTPDTWEVALSAGKDKAETFRRLLDEGKLGGLAFLRNLRNMEQAGITKSELIQAVGNVRFNKVLPFRFIAAARAVPAWEDLIEPLMLKAAEGLPKLKGLTVLLVDVSGSMADKLSGKSDLTRLDAGAGLAILLRETCEEGAIFTFDTSIKAIPPRRGFALRDAIGAPRGGTALGHAVVHANQVKGMKRLIVVTDEQSHDRVGAPACEQAYMINVGAYKNGVGYGNGWTHIDGWSENVVRYITALEGATVEATNDDETV
jgi:hypothetical protein